MKKGLTPKARDLRKRQTDAEAKLWRALRDRRLDGFKFKRQVPCGPHIVDFLCAEAGLVIEVDGGHHWWRGHQGKDFRRDRALRSQGLQVLRFSNLDVLHNLDAVVIRICDEVEESLSTGSGDARGNPP